MSSRLRCHSKLFSLFSPACSSRKETFLCMTKAYQVLPFRSPLKQVPPLTGKQWWIVEKAFHIVAGGIRWACHVWSLFMWNLLTQLKRTRTCMEVWILLDFDAHCWEPTHKHERSNISCRKLQSWIINKHILFAKPPTVFNCCFNFCVMNLFASALVGGNYVRENCRQRLR